MVSKKIAVTGAQYSGKTTLIKNISTALKKRGYSVCILGEVVRDCPFPINETTSVKAQDWVLEEQKRREDELKDKCDVILTDRCLLDNFAYWKRAAERIGLGEKEIRLGETEVFNHANSYSAILFLQPFEVKRIESDKFRSIDKEWREEMHKRILDVIKKFSKKSKVPVFYIRGDERKMFEQAMKRVFAILIPPSK